MGLLCGGLCVAGVLELYIRPNMLQSLLCISVYVLVGCRRYIHHFLQPMVTLGPVYGWKIGSTFDKLHATRYAHVPYTHEHDPLSGMSKFQVWDV